MGSSGSLLLLAVALSILSFVSPAQAVAVGPVTQLSGPGDFTTTTTAINFDGIPDATAANTLYLVQGVRFSNCNPLPCSSAPVPILDWTDSPLSRMTTSPTNVIGTVDRYQNTGSQFSDFLDLIFTSPTLEVGAYFGNDQGLQPTMQMQLSVFDVNDALIGSVLVGVNANTSVDQFAGLRSNSTPFYRARFQHILAQGDLSVVLDDVRFTMPVPEPSSGVLLGSVIGVMAWRRRSK